MSKVTTKNEVRLSYVNLITPRAQNQEKPEELTYSSAILIPKTDTETLDAVKAAIKEALEEGIQKKWGGKAPKGLKNPLRDGDEERDDDNYAGHYFLNAKGPRGGKEQPVLLDASNGNQATTDPQVIYSGVNARVTLQFYPFDVNGNRGVACGISAVLSSGKGEPLANTVTAASARDEFGVTTTADSAAAEFSPAPAAVPTAATSADSDAADPWES